MKEKNQSKFKKNKRKEKGHPFFKILKTERKKSIKIKKIKDPQAFSDKPKRSLLTLNLVGFFKWKFCVFHPNFLCFIIKATKRERGDRIPRSQILFLGLDFRDSEDLKLIGVY